MFLDLVGAEAAQRFRAGILPFVDLFAGAGGTSKGVLQAMSELKLPVQLCAVNHNETAIASHEANHPGHLHFCTGVDRIEIDDLLANYDCDGLFGLWASPSCVNFSAARGGVPVNPQDRSGCWAVVKWLRRRRAIHFWVENVKEFLRYGPLLQKRDKRGVPLFLYKDAKGRYKECYFPSKADRDVGYSLEFHSGAARPRDVPAKKWWKQTEAQFGIIPAMVPDKSRLGEYFRDWVAKIRKLGYDVEWRLLDAANYGAPTRRTRLIVQGVKRNTNRRVVWPFATHAEPDERGQVPDGMLPWRTTRSIINWNDLGTSIFSRPRPLSDKTIARIAVGLLKYGLEASVIKFKGTGTANSADEPLGTVQASGMHYGLMQPSASVIIPQQRGRKDELRVKSVDAPFPTVTGAGADALASSIIVGVGGPTGTSRPKPVSAPLGTVVGQNHRGLANAFIVPQFGERPTQMPRTHSIDEPAPAVTSHGAGALVNGVIEPFLVVTNHGNGKEGAKANNRRARSIDAPMDTLTGSRSLALADARSSKMGDIVEMPTIINTWQDLAAAIKDGYQKAKKDPTYRPLVSIKGKVIRLEILFRMLRWRELARAQSFPDSYVFHGTDTQKIKQIGNAVAPALSRALILASVSQRPCLREFALAA
jgi:DNA (cytosine-5)-methyltransferase 1